MVLGCDIEVDSENRALVEGLDGGREFVVPHVACGDAEAVVE